MALTAHSLPLSCRVARADARAASRTTSQVHAHAIFLSSLGGAAERLKAALPAGRSSICLDSSEVPEAFKAAFKSSVLRDDGS